jgi:large subunit ribosomal protein L21
MFFTFGQHFASTLAFELSFLHTARLSPAGPCARAQTFGDSPMAYAIIEDSGTQLKVEPGDRFEIDLRDLKEGQTTITFDKVLLVSGDAGVKIGQPVVAGATVTAKILGQIKDDKVWVERFTRRKGFHRRVGHRQKYIAVQVEAING